MAKRTFWKLKLVRADQLEEWLTAHNLQPSKFKIYHSSPGWVGVVYVEKEVANEE